MSYYDSRAGAEHVLAATLRMIRSRLEEDGYVRTMAIIAPRLDTDGKPDNMATPVMVVLQSQEFADEFVEKVGEEAEKCEASCIVLVSERTIAEETTKAGIEIVNLVSRTLHLSINHVLLGKAHLISKIKTVDGKTVLSGEPNLAERIIQKMIETSQENG